MKGKKVFKNITSTIFMQFITIVCNFIIPVTLIKAYGSKVNGLVTSVTQFLGYITLLESGIGPVIKSVLYKPIAKKNTEEIKKILKSTERFFRVISYIFIVYIIILVIVFPVIMQEQFDIFFTASLVVIISISTFAEYYFGMTYALFLQSNQENYVVSNIRIITMLINVIVVVILVKIGSSIQLVKLSTVLIFAIRPLLLNLYVKKKYNINLKDVKNDYKLEQKWDGLAQHVASVVHHNTDVTILTFFCDISEVSVYSVYTLITNGIKQTLNSLVTGIDAFLGNIIANDNEKELHKYFDLYETLYFIMLTIIFACTFMLILPFVKVYTKGITDISYIRPAFSYLIVLSEFVCMLRLPYIEISYSAGHFKETRKGAWVEALSNIIISIFLVFKFGIIGVAIGTLVAMLIRTVEFVYHANKYILKTPISKSLKKIFLVIFEILIILGILKFIPMMEINNYLNWVSYALIVFSIACVVTLGINCLFYIEQLKLAFKILKNIFRRSEKVKK